MITKKIPQDKSHSLEESMFVDIRNLDIKSREKIVQRHILAVKEFVKKSRLKNPIFSWNVCPWPVQFLPVITKFFSEWGKINAINPALSGFSGLMGMSKMEMNDNLNKKFRPRNLFLKTLPKSRGNLVKKFQKKYGESPKFPVIFKPNIGERASGVSFIREDQLDKFLSENKNLQDIIFEEFISTKLEFGLSWIRNPKTEVIEIVSLVQKNTPQVSGNAKKFLRDLIIEKCAELSLDKSREKKILDGFSKTELQEKITGKKNIVRTASISYGTNFEKIILSAEQKEKLVKLIKEFLQNFAGIYVGRFDIKSNSIKDLLAKKCFILEMNGVGGTPLEIYDEKISINEKYVILFNYFSRIFMIADTNIAEERGEKISRLDGLKTLTKNFFGRKKTQELPETVWKNIREVLKISLKERFKASDLGKLLAKF